MVDALEATAITGVLENSDLPEGWRSVKLGEICERPQYGWTTSAVATKHGVRLLRTTDISSGEVNWSSVPGCTEEPPDIGKYLLSAGDIVISRAGSVGISYLVEDSPMAVFASYLIRIRPLPGIESAYVSCYLQSPAYWTAIRESSSGITLANINGSKLSDLVIPLPPLAEQKRIVAKVKELLAPVNASRERLGKLPVIIKRFRQSVLAAACSGRLTADWREDHPEVEPAEELVKRALAGNRGRLGLGARQESAQPDYQGPELPESWTWISMRELVGHITSGSRGWGKYYSDGGPLFVRAQDINTDKLDLSRVAHVNLPTSADSERDRARVQPGDLLITITGANVTRSAIVDATIPEAYVSQHVALVRFAIRDICRYAHMWVVCENYGRAKLLDAAYGAGKPGLNLENIRELEIALPPLEEQEEIARRAEALLSLADTVEKRVQAATVQADRITQAVLAKAFRGELIPTEAELARAEGRDYEPASVLLAVFEKSGSQRLSRVAGSMTVIGGRL